MKKTRVVFVYNNFGIGGITKSLLVALSIIDYTKYDVTLYIRRDDVLDFISEVPEQVNIMTVENEVKKKIFENNFKGRLVKAAYNFLIKKHKHLAKQLFIQYKYPIQRKKEEEMLNDADLCWDIAISFSTDGDDPIFVENCINAKKKYIFIHQSTKISKRNIASIRKFDGIISVNPLLVPWINSFIKSPKKIYVLENFVEYEKIKKLALQTEVHTYDEKLIIATCGRLCQTKGFDYVVRSADILKKRGFNFIWYWIGGGPNQHEMEKLIKDFDLENEIIITGAQTNPYPYINLCHIYVQPSRAEAFGLTIIEAMILAKIVITTKTKGGNYIINKYNCGFLVDEEPQDIASQITTIVNDDNLKNKEILKVQSINWEKEKTRYIDDWEALLSGNIDNLKHKSN